MNNLEELGKEIERLEKEKSRQSHKRWRAKNGERYYTVDSFIKRDIEVDNIILEDAGYNVEINDELDNFNYKTRNYFKTKEEAEEYRERLKTYYDLMDLAKELNAGEEIDWNNDIQVKFFLFYNFIDNKIFYSATCNFKNLGQIYCLDENFLEIAKEKIGEERLVKLFKEER